MARSLATIAAAASTAAPRVGLGHVAMTLRERLAIAAANAFQEAAEEVERWPTLPEYKRATFREMAGEALATARQYRRAVGLPMESILARVCSDVFLGNPSCPHWLRVQYDWTTGVQRQEARPVFLQIARAILAEGRAAKAEAAGQVAA